MEYTIPMMDDSAAQAALKTQWLALQRAIIEADDQKALQQAARRIQDLTQQLVEQSPDVQQLTHTISAFNDALTRRVIDVCIANTNASHSLGANGNAGVVSGAQNGTGALQWCWISLGSEGRQEQTLWSDQDNGIIFLGAGPADPIRAQLLPLARRINEALDACGFPLCSGDIMASNPHWCLSLAEWRERFDAWIIEGNPQALLNASIFFDLRPLYGAHHLAQQLCDTLAQEAVHNTRFLFQMAANALRRTPPLGLLRRFIVEKDGPYAGTIDLKLHGATLFVDAARIYALACGTSTSNTADRLRFAARAKHLHPGDVERWIAAFYVIQMLRLKQQHSHYAGQAQMHNHVNPNLLDPSERAALKDALRQARALQQQLELDFPGSSAGM
jgi:CBS domain-containing protein